MLEPPVTLKASLDELLAHTRRRVAGGIRSAGTLAMQVQHVSYLLERLPGDLPIADLSAELIEAFADSETEGRRGRPLSAGTLLKRLSTLRQALKRQRRRRRLEVLPDFPEIEYRYEPDQRHLRAYDDYKEISLALPQERAEWFALAVWTGQRHSDVERMTKDDFDPTARPPWVRVRSWKTRRRVGIRVPAAPEIVRVFAAKWRRLKAGAPLVAPWPYASSALTKICRRIGRPPIAANTCRHTFFTWAVAGNGFTAELIQLGGWTDLKMLSQVYAHALPVRFGATIVRLVDAAGAPRRPPRAKNSRRTATRTGSPSPPANVRGRGGARRVTARRAPDEPAAGDTQAVGSHVRGAR